MPHFPKKEADIVALAKHMIAGYRKHAVDFPSIGWLFLNFMRIYYANAKKSQSDAYNQSRLASKMKNASLKKLIETMKVCLRKSEVDVASNPEKLSLIGWGPPKTPQSIEKPGQPNNLRSANQGRGSITLEWDRPACGGTVRNYIIQRRCQQETDGKFDSWKLIATAYRNRIILKNQPQKSTLEYHVKAVNISGESMPSNVIAAVL